MRVIACHASSDAKSSTTRFTKLLMQLRLKFKPTLIEKANLVETLEDSVDEDEKVKVLIEFEYRLLQGFDLHFQDFILKAKVFSILELLLCDSSCSIRIQDLVIAALVRFNKDGFVGLVLMGPTVRVLISMSSCCSIRVLSLLIKLIIIPLVDELEAYKEIPRIISLLSSENVSIQVGAIDCIL
ncbi:hypothetical protein CRYUN_Cryun33cG0102500 [Craigia yunnanensis]